MTDPALDSPYAWRLAFVSMLCIAVGTGGLYLPVVAMTQIAAEFGERRQVPSLAYTLAYVGTGLGGIGMGWLADRVGPRWPVAMAGAMIGLGTWGAARSDDELALLASFGLGIGLLGHAGTFTPLLANVTRWFERRRGTAVAVVAVGNALGGVLWPQIYRLALPAWGWRQTLFYYGMFAAVALVGMAFYVRPAPGRTVGKGAARPVETFDRLPYSSPVTMALLAIAGLACCTPMAMPVVHMVAFCGDLGFAAARGSEAISLILTTGIACAFVTGSVVDRIGAMPTLLIASSIQATALAGFLIVDDLAMLYAVSAVFGISFLSLVQCYAIVLREFYGPAMGSWRIGYIMLFTLSGMALGGWLAGVIFDATLRYAPAFLAGLGFNLLNLLTVLILYVGWRRVRRRVPAG